MFKSSSTRSTTCRTSCGRCLGKLPRNRHGGSPIRLRKFAPMSRPRRFSIPSGMVSTPISKIRRSLTAMPTGFLLLLTSHPQQAAEAERLAVRSTSMIRTTAISACGTTRLNSIGTMPGRILRMEIKSCLWTRTTSLTRGRRGITARLR